MLPHSKDGGPHILWVRLSLTELALSSVLLRFRTFCLIIAVDGIIDVDKVSVCHKTVMWPPELCQRIPLWLLEAMLLFCGCGMFVVFPVTSCVSHFFFYI